MCTRSHSSAKNILSESAAVASSLCSSDGEASGRVDTSFHKHNFAIDQARPLSLVSQLPKRLPSILQHHIDLVVCGEYETAVKIKDIGVFCIIIINDQSYHNSIKFDREFVLCPSRNRPLLLSLMMKLMFLTWLKR